MTHTETNIISRGDDTLQASESSAMIHNREASVQRYKEKRRNRLFAKTIRYEVRKLNAEKRPRIKVIYVTFHDIVIDYVTSLMLFLYMFDVFMC